MRTSLTVRETAFLLQISEMKVRRKVENGELRAVGKVADRAGRRKIRIDAESVCRYFPRNGSFQLRRILMYEILDGRMKPPSPTSRWGQPAALSDAQRIVAEGLRGAPDCNR